MIFCDKCENFEHLSCRGLLKPPPEGQPHECLNCRHTGEGTIQEDIRVRILS